MLGTRFRKDIAPIALPIFLGMLVFQIQILTNRAFLGRLDVDYLATLSNVVFPMWTTMAVLFALATGATILMSQAIGARNGERARDVAAASIKWNGALSLVIFCFWFFGAGAVFDLMGVQGDIRSYCVRYTSIAAFSFLFIGVSSSLHAVFQASGNTRPIMYAGALRSILNIGLDWLLIFGNLGFPRLELEGAALASIISDLVGTAFLALMLFRGRDLQARPRVRAVLSAPFTRYGEIARMGIPTSLEDLLWNVGNLFLLRFLNMLDPLAAAVYGLVFGIEILPIALFGALGQTTTVLVGRAKGAGSMVAARGAVFTAQAAAWIVSVALTVTFAAIPGKLVSIFTSDGSVIARAAPILLISCVTFFPRSVNFMAGSGIRGLGDTRWMLFTQSFGTLFLIGAGYLLIFAAGLGVVGLFVAMSADEAIRAATNGIRFLRSSRAAAAVGPELLRKAA